MSLSVAGVMLLTVIVAGLPSAVARPAAVPPAERPGPHEMNSADCRWTMVGSGGPDWRRGRTVSGPVAVLRRPLGQMSRYANGMVTKMPILVAGHRTIRVSAPRRLRQRVFLYYGRFLDRNGRRTTGFARAHGHNATEFHPCTDRPRTIWPGGIRVKGMKPVTLRIDVEGRERPYFLKLGRPKVPDRDRPTS